MIVTASGTLSTIARLTSAKRPTGTYSPIVHDVGLPLKDMPTGAKVYRHGTHRALNPEATEAAILAHARELGITRVANVTGLDFLGIPVVMVVRPRSRNLSVAQGKGLTLAAAIASGLGEAVELSCAERVTGPTTNGRLGDAVAASPYVIPEWTLIPGRSTGETTVDWTRCQNLVGGPERLVPSELVFADFTSPPPHGQGYFFISTNGLAVGNSREEAQLHGVCEVIERDALALSRARTNRGQRLPLLDISTVTAPSALGLLAQLESAGLSVELRDITSDIGVPCYSCRIDDTNAGEVCLGAFSGSGCHPSSDVGLCRAIAEAAQSRLTVIVGARDDLDRDRYRTGPRPQLPPALQRARPAPTFIQFVDRSLDTDQIESDLTAVMERLRAADVRDILCADLSCPVPEMSCVRIVIPDLEPFPDVPWYQPGLRARAIAAVTA